MSAPAISQTAAPKSGMGLFARALLISLLVHLSAITLFRIVIYFPPQSTRYYPLAFLQETPADEAPAVAPSGLVAALTLPRAARTAELPKLAFNPSGEVALGRLSLGTSFFQDNIDPARPVDSWERFGEGVQRVRSSLLSLAGANDTSADEIRVGETRANTLDLGPGLTGSIAWSGAAPRELLATPPAFFRRDVPNFAAEYLLTIAPDGTVRDVVSLNTEPSGMESSVRAFLERCRFAPDLNSVREVTITLAVQSTPDEPSP